nr:poly(3-hydroxyalkanoate) depolymerase [Kineosphaera limosa]
MLGQQVRISIRPGTGTGPPLLICNGIGAGLDLLDPFVDRLDPAIEVIRFDVPGVGGSPTPALPYTFAVLSAFVTRLLDRLDYDRFDVLGISWGGGLAQQLAFQNPRRCRRVVLVSTGTGMLMVPAHPRVLALMLTGRRYRDPAYAGSVAAQLYGGRMRNRPERAATLMHDQSRVGSGRVYLYQLLAGVGWSSLPALPLIRQQALILAGVDDPLIPVANARLMHTLLPHARLHLYDDGHLGLITSAQELAPLVSEFLEAAD